MPYAIFYTLKTRVIILNFLLLCLFFEAIASKCDNRVSLYFLDSKQVEIKFS